MPSHEAFSSAMIRWFSEHGKQYPFRETNDPYWILVCEILLRKTTSRQVSAIYSSFFERFPMVLELSGASPDEVLEFIRPLGLHGRAGDLVHVARDIVELFDGAVPSSLEDLMEMRGVGGYVADCVLSFGYGFWIPMVDSNVERVLGRLVMGKDKVKASRVAGIYEQLGRPYASRELHSAIIDLSHAHCRPKNPDCRGCPVHCLCVFSAHTVGTGSC